ncbi:DNA-3-methyladenine glycosylase [Jatrophihabitans sp. DSM 45814]
MIDRDQLSRPALEVAPTLLGAILKSSVDGVEVSVRVTEVEAYEGALDPASHAFRGRTKRNAVMFGAAGHLYCYFIYGMHWCANVTCGTYEVASAVLLRSGQIVSGEAAARGRTPTKLKTPMLASGPARLARCLGLTGERTGTDLLARSSLVQLLELGEEQTYSVGPRVGIAVAADFPWRFWLPGEPSVSPYRVGGRRSGSGVGARSANGINRQT